MAIVAPIVAGLGAAASGIGAAAAGAGATLAGSAGTLAAVGSAVGAGASLLAAGRAPKMPGLDGAPISPNAAKSLVDAQAAADKRRRETLLSGGNTNPTGGSGSLLQPKDLRKRTLLG